MFNFYFLTLNITKMFINLIQLVQAGLILEKFAAYAFAQARTKKQLGLA